MLVLLILSFGAQQLQGQQASRSSPSASPEVHLGKGYDALKQDRYDAAIIEFRAALQGNPKLVLRAGFPLAVALFESHQYAESRKEFETVRREAGDHPNLQYYLGRLDLQDRNYPAAIEKLTKASIKPPFPDTAYYLGFAYFKQGELESAAKWLEEAARVMPQDARVPYQLGLVYRKQGREEQAKQAIAKSEELRRRDDSQSRLKLECSQKLDQGPREAARAFCDQLYDPDDAEKLTALGILYGQHGDPEASLKPLKRAAELAPQNPQMQFNLALAYYYLNRLDDARAPLETAIKRWPDLFQLNALYGAVLLKQGELLPAYHALHHANQINPQDPATAEQLYAAAMLLAEQDHSGGHYSESLGYLKEAAALRPQEAEPHRRMAAIFKAMGEAGQSASEEKQAERLAGSGAQ